MNIGYYKSGRVDHCGKQVAVKAFNGQELSKVTYPDPEVLRWKLRQPKEGEGMFARRSAQETCMLFKEAGRIFSEASLPMGGQMISPREYARLFSLATGAVISAPLNSMKAIAGWFSKMESILEFQAMNGDLDVYSNGYTNRNNRSIGWIPRGRNVFVMTPSNHPSVNILWAIAAAMGYPVTLRPSLQDPFTPKRMIQAMIQAGASTDSLSFLPSSHEALPMFMKHHDLSILFGGEELVERFHNNSNTKVFGPGHSAIVVGEDRVNDIDQIVSVALRSMTQDGGRGCINASMIITESNSEAIARALAEAVAKIPVLDPLDEAARIPAFGNEEHARRVDEGIESQLAGAVDLTREIRGTPRFVKAHGTSFLMPTVIHCGSEHADTPIAGREYPFPFVTVVEAKGYNSILRYVSESLVVSLLSSNETLFQKLLFAPGVGKVYNDGSITCAIDFVEAHEGFMSEFLFKTKAVRKSA